MHTYKFINEDCKFYYFNICSFITNIFERPASVILIVNCAVFATMSGRYKLLNNIMNGFEICHSNV